RLCVQLDFNRVGVDSSARFLLGDFLKSKPPCRHFAIYVLGIIDSKY
ncbi:MAG: hypothetical protein ACI9EW_002971, partial [Cellvibrionaceae bacterium]